MLHNDLPEAMRPHMRRVALSVPLPMGDKVITEVWLRYPTAKYLAENKAVFDENISDAESSLLSVALATGLTRDQAEEIDMDDFSRISEEMADFFEQRASQSKTPVNGDQSSLTAQPS